MALCVQLCKPYYSDVLHKMREGQKMGHHNINPAKIALAKSFERDTWNTLTRHRQKCPVYMGQDATQNCLICRNVYEEWQIAMRRLGDLLT